MYKIMKEVKKQIQNEYIRNADMPKLSEIASLPDKYEIKTKINMNHV